MQLWTEMRQKEAKSQGQILEDAKMLQVALETEHQEVWALPDTAAQ